METVNKRNTAERKTTILTVADWRLNRLLEAIFRVNLDFERALNLFPSFNPKYCIGESAAVGDSLAAFSSGLNPNIKPKTKNATNTNGAYHRLGAF
jgi:hypothetical protein